MKAMVHRMRLLDLEIVGQGQPQKKSNLLIKKAMAENNNILNT
jgi:hypothetical protein